MAKSLLATLGFLLLTIAAGAVTPPIGTVSAPGNFRLDSLAVQNTATVFSGSLLETGQAAADVKLNHRVQIRMAAASTGNIFTDRMVLLAGASEITAQDGYRVDAAGLTVTPGPADAQGRIAINSDQTVQVSAITGVLAVKDSSGRLIAELRPGNSLTFAALAAPRPASSPKQITASGVLVKENGKLYLQETDNIRYELKGNIPAKLVGKKIVVRGVVQPGEDGGSAIQVSAIAEANKVGSMTPATKWIIIGAGAAAATIPIVYYSTHSNSPASR